MSVKTEKFGVTAEGKEVTKFTLENSKGMKAGIINYGAIIVDLFVPDKNGKLDDVVLGFNELEPYVLDGCGFGALIGPNANRTGNASFELEGKTYHLAVNDGVNNLHSDAKLGYQKRVWDAEATENSVTLSLTDEDGCMGFPGNKKVSIVYTLTEDNGLELHYHAESDQNTIINLTNHSYFNLAGHAAGSIHEHKLQLNASRFTPVVKGAIPTGELATVKGTAFDFTTMKKVGLEIDADEEQLKLVNGYDHNYVVDDADGTLREIAIVEEETSGRIMKVYTDLPGVQFYAGNSIGKVEGAKDGATYVGRDGLCLETQYFPDSANKKEFPSTVFGPDRVYDTVTVYKFE